MQFLPLYVLCCGNQLCSVCVVLRFLNICYFNKPTVFLLLRIIIVTAVQYLSLFMLCKSSVDFKNLQNGKFLIINFELNFGNLILY